MKNVQQIINNTINFIKETAIYKRINKAVDEGIEAASLKGHFLTKINVVLK